MAVCRETQAISHLRSTNMCFRARVQPTSTEYLMENSPTWSPLILHIHGPRPRAQPPRPSASRQKGACAATPPVRRHALKRDLEGLVDILRVADQLLQTVQEAHHGVVKLLAVAEQLSVLARAKPFFFLRGGGRRRSAHHAGLCSVAHQFWSLFGTRMRRGHTIQSSRAAQLCAQSGRSCQRGRDDI